MSKYELYFNDILRASGIFIAGAVWQQFRNMQNDLHQIKGATGRLLRVEHEHNLFMEGKLNHKKNYF